MRVSNVEAAQSRERIIEAAASQFRARGFDGIGVVDLMKAAGMTKGAFYGHFESKEELMAIATMRGLDSLVEGWQQLAETEGENALHAFAAEYLSLDHRDNPADGCTVATLGAESARHGALVRGAFTKGIRAAADLLTNLVPGKSARARRERALTAYASMVGAVVLARATDDQDFSEELLRSVLKSIAPNRT
ncbi:TetR family transcriptional regulator [Pseudomonas gingeri]|uniref:TetR family transcriptional regulator n=1 Tax=Pseudomonas gingeri TaxID=117681 RepID=A0A7Y8C1L7_9PSED|nr:TetR family transcriptional regulator [Pseudomonas gingeri]NWA28673.1 TetR family transcriptional regulator [Pseudomonas gingeri]NWB95749.1 TetR family transcriptional regulator [Pseudomonas gingeri]